MTYTVSSGTLNPSIPIPLSLSLSLSIVWYLFISPLQVKLAGKIRLRNGLQRIDGDDGDLSAYSTHSLTHSLVLSTTFWDILLVVNSRG